MKNTKSSKRESQYDFYFYTYDRNDAVRTQQKRILGYTIKEMLIIESLNKSQLGTRYGDGTFCAHHKWKWSMEVAKLMNFKSEFDRQMAIEKENKDNGKVCLVCNSSRGLLYETTSEEYIHANCNVKPNGESN